MKLETKAFILNYEQQRHEIQAVMEKEKPEWLKNPGAFWGGVDLSPQSSAGAALQQVCNTGCVFKDEGILGSARRRLALLRLNDFQRVVEDEIQDIRDSGLKLQKSSTLGSLVINVLWSLVNSGKRQTLVDQLRTARRYGRCGAGMALGIGNVWNYLVWERCHQNEFSLIIEHCTPSTAALDPLGTVLKNALSGPELYLMQIHDAVLSCTGQATSQDINDIRALDGLLPLYYLLAIITPYRNKATAEEEIHGKPLPSCEKEEGPTTTYRGARKYTTQYAARCRANG
jgi:hypothetical protein